MLAEIKEALQKNLDGCFLEEGFKLRKADFEYTKKVNDLRFIYRISIHSKSGWYSITPEVYVGSSKINKRFNEILNRQIQVTGTTCGFGIANETDQQRGRYQVVEIHEISSAAESILSDFKDIALPFYNKVNSHEAIDKYLNAITENKAPVGSVSNACFGLIVANIVNNPRFSELADVYFNFWSKSQSPEIAKDIIAVKNALLGTTDVIKA